MTKENPEKVLREVSDTNKAQDDPTNSFAEAKPSDHIQRKVYMMPESYNALRRELEQNFPTLWKSVQYDMAFNAQRFMSKMDDALCLVSQFDSGNVDGICKRYLDSLRRVRGLTPLHNESEYFANKGMEDQVKLARQMNEDGSWLLKH